MSAQTHAHQQRDVLTITPAGHAALDRVAAHLAAAIDASTPESIAAGLAVLYRLDISDLADNALDEEPPESGGVVGPHPPLRPATDRVYADGWRMQLPGWWPHRPDEPHHCHRQGHWTRDGSQLVLACCGLDAT
jgi:hypothetical protein